MIFATALVVSRHRRTCIAEKGGPFLVSFGTTMSTSMQRNVELNKRISTSGSLEDVVVLTRQHVQMMNLVNCVTALQRVAKLAGVGLPAENISHVPSHLGNVADSLSHVTLRAAKCFETEADSCQTRHVSGALWACAKLRIAPVDLVSAVMARGMAMNPSWFKPQEASMCVWALGKEIASDQQAAQFLVSKLLRVHLARPHIFDSQGLSNIGAGLAGFPALHGSSLVPLLVKSLRGRLSDFSPQELSNVLNALAKMGARLDECEGLAGQAAVACANHLEKFTPQNLANAAHGVSKLLENAALKQQERNAFDFWRLFAPAIVQRVSEFNAQELSMCTWAAGQAMSSWSEDAGGMGVSRVTGVLADAVLKKAQAMNAQQIATLALALVKLGCTDQETLRQLAKAARNKMREFKPQDLDNLASAYARLGTWTAPKLVKSIAAAGAHLLEEGHRNSFPPRNLSNLVCGVAKLAAACPEKTLGALAVVSLSHAASEKILTHLAEFNVRDLANAAWGLAALGGADHQCMRAIAKRAASTLGTYNAQECSKLLYAMGKANVRCSALEKAASAQRELVFDFEGPAGTVSLLYKVGGATGHFWEREDTGVCVFVLADFALLLLKAVAFFAEGSRIWLLYDARIPHARNLPREESQWCIVLFLCASLISSGMPSCQGGSKIFVSHRKQRMFPLTSSPRSHCISPTPFPFVHEHAKRQTMLSTALPSFLFFVHDLCVCWLHIIHLLPSVLLP